MLSLKLYNNKKKDDCRRVSFRANIRGQSHFANLTVGNNNSDDFVGKGEKSVTYSLNLEELEALHTAMGAAIKGMKNGFQTEHRTTSSHTN